MATWKLRLFCTCCSNNRETVENRYHLSSTVSQLPSSQHEASRGLSTIADLLVTKCRDLSWFCWFHPIVQYLFRINCRSVSRRNLQFDSCLCWQFCRCWPKREYGRLHRVVNDLNARISPSTSCYNGFQC